MSFLLPLLLTSFAVGQATLDGITFADQPGVLYVPLREVGQAFDWRVGHDRKTNTTKLNRRVLRRGSQRSLLDGTRLVAVKELRNHGTLVGWNAQKRMVSVKKKVRPGQAFFVRKGTKRVVVNRKTQEIRGWQGQRPVFWSKVSTGRVGKDTPPGIYKAQGYKRKLHRSTIYGGAAMPWSVQIVGNIFIHGFKTVAGRPSSNGCIRLPVEGRNPARWFYYWIERGTPVSVLGKWPKNAG